MFFFLLPYLLGFELVTKGVDLNPVNPPDQQATNPFGDRKGY